LQPSVARTFCGGDLRMREPDLYLWRQQALIREKDQELSADGLLPARLGQRALWRVRLSEFWLEVGIGDSHCRESASRPGGGTFTDAARRLGEDIIGYLATYSIRHATSRGAHSNGRLRSEKFVMRYAKNSLVINRERDIPLLLQVRNSRFISHQQLFEFMQYQGIDHSRSGFNWRTRRLLGSGYLSVCECRS